MNHLDSNTFYQKMGGVSGWLAVACYHVTCFLLSGLSKSLGVMIPTLTEQFTAATWQIGWIIAAYMGIIFGAGLLAVPLNKTFGTRVVVMVSGLVIGASMIVASLSTNIAMLTVMLLLGGPGIGVANILLRGLIGYYFTSMFATAISVGSAGHATGTLILAPFTQLLLDTYGWRGAMMLLGVLSMHLGVCGALLRDLPDDTGSGGPYKLITSSDENQSVCHAKNTSKTRSIKTATVDLANHLLWIVATVYVSARLVADLWIIYFVAQAQAKGFSAHEAVTFTTFAGIGGIVSKFAIGPVVDRGLLKLRPALALMAVANSLTFFIVPWVSSYWLMMINAVVCFSLSAAIGTLLDVYTRDVLGLDLLVKAIAWMELIGAILYFMVGYYPGWIYDQTGSYDLAFVIMGFIAALSLVALIAELVMKNAGYTP